MYTPCFLREIYKILVKFYLFAIILSKSIDFWEGACHISGRVPGTCCSKLIVLTVMAVIITLDSRSARVLHIF